MPINLLERAKTRRRIALDHVSLRKDDNSVFKKYRKIPHLSPAELAEYLQASRALRRENLFVN